MAEKKFRIYGPVILTVFLLIFFYAMLFEATNVAWKWSLIPVFYAILSCESGRLLVLYCRWRIPGISNVRKRIFLLIWLGIPLSGLVGLIDQAFTLGLGLYKQFIWTDYFFITGLNILCCTIVVGVYESHYYLQKWKALFIESENIKKQNSISQYHFLKEQIKPHFLFNSLNTLSALISVEPAKAELFVEEMSTVYRYLLTKNEKELTTLKEELIFLDSYLLMLRTRFGESLIVNIHIDMKLKEYLLPPFVLQILIENAVKHNVVSRDNPLTINLFTDANKNLHVENNMQLKPTPEKSESKGLANIILRYSLLNKEEGLEFEQKDGLFKVTIPLVKTNVYAIHSLLNS